MVQTSLFRVFCRPIETKKLNRREKAIASSNNCKKGIFIVPNILQDTPKLKEKSSTSDALHEEV